VQRASRCAMTRGAGGSAPRRSPTPVPTPIYRIVHVDNLPLIVARGALHAFNHALSDGRTYVTIHDADVQASRQRRAVPCGCGGTILDYVGFYFGHRSPMLYCVHTGWNVRPV